MSLAVSVGANKGIGFEIARAVACLEEDYKIILGCRSTERGSAAVAKLEREFKHRSFALIILDLSSNTSIRDFVKEVSLRHGKVDLLFHNAAIAPGYREAINVTINTNYFGTVRLNKLLLPLLQKSAKPNIVVVSSLLLKNAYSGCNKAIRERWRFAESEEAVNELVHEYVSAVEARKEGELGWPQLSKNTVYSISKLSGKANRFSLSLNSSLPLWVC